MSICLGAVHAQEVDTFYLHHSVSNNDTTVYKRIIQFEKNDSLYYVQDYYPNGHIQMEGTYSSIDKNIKVVSLWCNYSTNTKEGEFTVWYRNGQIKSKSSFLNGLREGLFEYWYSNGQRESKQHYSNGQKHGRCIWWNKDGTVQRVLTFKNGLNQNR